MSDIKFSCPQCQQHIQAEEGYAGMQIACPVCNTHMVVPGTPRPAPAPVPVLVSASSAAAPSSPPPPTPVSRAPAAPAQAATGTRFQPGAAAARPQPVRQAKTGVAGVLTSPYFYIAGAVLILSVLYLLGRSNPAMMLVFLGAAALYLLTAHIIVVVAAFQESASDGIFTLLCGIYALYFVFSKSDSPVLKALYASAALMGLVIKFMGMAQDAL